MSYGKVFSQFWTDKKIRSYSNDGKLLALYLLTSPHRNLIGCCHLPIGYISEDLQWGADRVATTLAELASGDKPFIVRDQDGWTHIVNSLKYDRINGQNHFLSAGKFLSQIPQDSPVFSSVAPKLAEIWNDGICRLPPILVRYLPRTLLSGFEVPTEDLPRPSPPAPAPAPPPPPPPNQDSSSGYTATPSRKRAQATAAKLPKGWVPSDEQVEYARKLGLVNGSVQHEAIKFEAYWTIGNGKDTRRSERGWSQTWITWIGKAAKDPQNSRGGHGNQNQHHKSSGDSGSGFAGVRAEARSRANSGDPE